MVPSFGHIFNTAADFSTFVNVVVNVTMPGPAACAGDGRHGEHCAGPFEHKQAATKGSEGLLHALARLCTALVVRNQVIVQELLLLAPVLDMFVYLTILRDTLFRWHI